MDAVGLGTDLTDLDHSAHLLTAALKLRAAKARVEVAEILVAGVQTVPAVVAHHAVRHAIRATLARERGWR